MTGYHPFGLACVEIGLTPNITQAGGTVYAERLVIFAEVDIRAFFAKIEQSDSNSAVA